MGLKRNITACLIALMFAMQLLLAQHYTVHFQERQSAPTEQGKADPDKMCQACLFSKSFSHATFAVNVDALLPVIIAEIIAPAPFSVRTQFIIHAYSSRGTHVFSA